jgi:peptidoglycan/LPS O-acetylase OafA/YrhL
MTISRYYRPELDLLRFIAFMMVFMVHRMDFIPIDAAQHPWLYNVCLLGDLGVPVFFLLSAFLITELLFRERDETGTIQLRAFYMRRILRIWPLYFLVFYGLVVLTRFVPFAGAKDPGAWLAFTFFAGNWWICWHGWVPAYPVNPLWSISVEEQFYIAIPIIALLGQRAGVKAVSLFFLFVSYVAVIFYAVYRTDGFSGQWTTASSSSSSSPPEPCSPSISKAGFLIGTLRCVSLRH